MEDFLSFLSKHIKASGMSVDEFVSKCGISRAKFYRFVKEPERFKKATLDKMAQLLKFDEADKKHLFEFISHTNTIPNSMDSMIYSYIYSEPSSLKNDEFFEFEYYDNDSDGVRKLSAKALADAVYKTGISKDDPADCGNYHHSFNVYIYNCTSESILSSLAGLFYSLENKIMYSLKSEGLIDSVTTQFSHFLGFQSSRLNNKLDLLKKITPILSNFNDYNYYFEEIESPVWTAKNDICVISYCKTNKKGGDEQLQYFVIKSDESGKLYVSPLGNNRYLYEFFAVDAMNFFSRLPSGKRKMSASDSPMSANLIAYTLSLKHTKATIHYDLCFDNIDHSVWLSAFNRADSVSKAILAAILDSQGAMSGLSDNQKITQVLEYIGNRYKVLEETEAVSIMSSIGLKELVKKGYIRDLDVELQGPNGIFVLGELFRFDKSELVGMLKAVKSRLGATASSKTQRFYLEKQLTPTNKNSIAVFQDSSLIVFSPQSVHLLDAMTFFDDPEAANAFYSFISNTLIKNRGEFESPLMSDEAAVEFIDELIASLG
jgi:hypothetical protein